MPKKTLSEPHQKLEEIIMEWNWLKDDLSQALTLPEADNLRPLLQPLMIDVEKHDAHVNGLMEAFDRLNKTESVGVANG